MERERDSEEERESERKETHRHTVREERMNQRQIMRKPTRQPGKSSRKGIRKKQLNFIATVREKWTLQDLFVWQRIKDKIRNSENKNEIESERVGEKVDGGRVSKKEKEGK